MRILVATVLAIGLVGSSGREASASPEKPAASLDASLLLAHQSASAASDSSIQLARHCGPPRGYYHRGGHFHHHHYRGGGYYRGYPGGYGPVYYPRVPVAPYGGSGFGLYIGF